MDKRPNPRKVWPYPQQCPICNKKMRVCEIYGIRVETTRLTAPGAPKNYIKKLERAAKKK